MLCSHLRTWGNPHPAAPVEQLFCPDVCLKLFLSEDQKLGLFIPPAMCWHADVKPGGGVAVSSPPPPPPPAEQGRTSQEETGEMLVLATGEVGSGPQLNYPEHQGKSRPGVRKIPGGGKGCGQPQLHRTSLIVADFLITSSGKPPSIQAVYLPRK